MGPARATPLAEKAPPELLVCGIDEDTAVIVQPGAVPPRTLVKYTLDSEGYVHRVWILTQQEAAQRDKAQ